MALAAGSLANELILMKEYAEEEMPHTLSPLMDGVFLSIQDAYAHAGQPDGLMAENPDAALLWFEQKYMQRKQQLEIQSAQDVIEQTFNELMMMGDAIRQPDGEIVLLPKSAARSVVFHLAEIVQQADDEGQRDLDTSELMSMEYFLSVALVAVTNYKKRHKI